MLWACDFFSKKVWTAGALVDVFVLFFLHVGTRRVHVAGVTAQPDKPWVVQQARNAALLSAEQPVRPRFLLRDHDAKFVKEFDAVLGAEGVEVRRLGPVAPNLNAYAERWVQAVKQECLDHVVAFGKGHLRHLVREYVAHYNRERPHQAKGNAPLGSYLPEEGHPRAPSEVYCRERLGGLLRHYSRRAA
jgi:putative transposase